MPIINKENNILFVAYYDLMVNSNRNVAVSAANKIDYIISLLNRNGYIVNILSPAESKYKGFQSRQIRRFENNTLFLFPSYHSELRIINYFSRIFTRIFFMIELIRSCVKFRTVIIYHSMSLRWVIFFLKLLKCDVILELEELYSDLVESERKMKKIEIKYINKYEKFILSNVSLSKYIENKSNLVVINGNYFNNNFNEKKKQSSTINLVYSGTFEKSKGVIEAIHLAEKLPSEYCLHILGYGNNQEVTEVKSLINKINEYSLCEIKYLGLLKGEEFDVYLSENCDIGLICQDIHASYSSTSFPSKILSYLRNGLAVLSVDEESIRNSEVSPLIHFYQDNNFYDVLRSISVVEQKKKNSSFLKKLDEKKLQQINELVK